jgi:hypothetical protein
MNFPTQKKRTSESPTNTDVTNPKRQVGSTRQPFIPHLPQPLFRLNTPIKRTQHLNNLNPEISNITALSPLSPLFSEL